MIIRNLNKKYLLLVLTSFYFFSLGKYIVIFVSFYLLIKKFLKNKILKSTLVSYKYFYIIFTLFTLAFMSGIIQDNDIFQIIRNNYFTLVFIIIGIQVHNSFKNLETLYYNIIKYIFLLALFQFLLYLISMFNLSFHLFMINIFIPKTGYAIGFAGLGNIKGFGMKMVTALTPLYLFLIPYMLFSNNKKIKLFSYLIILLIAASGSLTQYSILILYFIFYILYLLKNAPLYLVKKIVSIKFLLITIILISALWQSGLISVISNKIDLVKGVSESVAVNTVSVRKLQFDILMDEFIDEPVFGKGLGYDSIKYHWVRDLNGLDPNKKYNYSMYENQFLDILMKFGIFSALFIFILFIFLPILLLFHYYLKYKNKIYLSTIFSYIGFVIYSLSNGNTFYMYTSMFIWGIIIGELGRIIAKKNLIIQRENHEKNCSYYP